MSKFYKLSFILFCLLIQSIILNAQKGLQFDGINDRVDFGTSPIFNITDSLTVEIKVKQSVAQNYPTYISNFQDSLGYWKGYWMGGDNTGHVSWFIGSITTPSAGYWVSSTVTISDGNWHHLTGTYAGDTARLYVDGVFQDKLYTPSPHLFSSYNLIGGNDIYNDIYQGSVDDIRLWHTVRTPTMIMQYKDSCLKGNESKLVALYHFERGVGGSKVYDLTSANNTGTLTNMDTVNAWVPGINCKACDVYSLNISVTQSVLTLTSNQAGAKYRWLKCNQSYAFTGAINQSFNVSSNGSYAVEVNRYNCIDTSNCINIMNVGIIENSLNGNEVKVYPNPSNGTLHIMLANKEENVDVTVFDLTGRQLSTDHYQNTEHIKFNLDLPQGLYLIQVESKGNKSVFKLQKE